MNVILDSHDRRTPAVLKLIAYLEARLVEHRAKNDNPLDADATATLRGRIAELKHLQDLLATGES